MHEVITRDEDKKKLLLIITTKLVDRAYDEVVKFKTFDNWDDMKKALNSCLTESRSIAHIQSELLNISQLKNEDIRTYSARVQKLLSELNNACIESEGDDCAKALQKTNEKLAINAFQNGISNESLKLFVKACRLTSLKDSIGKAYEESMNCKPSTSSNVSSESRNQLKCKICKKLGHTSAVCFQRYAPSQNQPFHPSPNQNSRSGFQFPNPNQTQQTQNVCAYCECRKRVWNQNQKAQLLIKQSGNKVGLDQTNMVKPDPPKDAPVRVQNLK